VSERSRTTGARSYATLRLSSSSTASVVAIVA
jgi:hypothetical protein